ncbi:MAG: diguanylate cyclase [Kofleriaceae bacterium]|nr:diguanylate cyclase [Kofleriaceae bacterium]
MLAMELKQFVSELDAAMQAHLEWSRKVLRCAVVRTTPGDDVLKAEAHLLCSFGRWFTQHRINFEVLDAARTQALETQHHAMHDAIRVICNRVLYGEAGQAEDLDQFESTQRQLVDLLAFFKTLAVSRSSQIDPLTALPLRHRMEQDFDLLSKHIRHRGSVQLVMIVDVDHFKAVNDQYGHAGGDLVLQSLATTLKRVIRDDDLVYRYGGEEFLLLMELSATPHAEDFAATRVLEAVRAMSVELPNGVTVTTTVTIGVALAGEDESLESAIHRADLALYKGKASGRNRHVLAEAAPEEKR